MPAPWGSLPSLLQLQCPFTHSLTLVNSSLSPSCSHITSSHGHVSLSHACDRRAGDLAVPSARALMLNVLLLAALASLRLLSPALGEASVRR